MERGAWQATVHGVVKSRTQLSYWTTTNSCKQERQLHHKVDLRWPTVLVLAFKVLCCRNFSVQAKQGGWSPLVEYILIGIFFLSCFIVLKMWNCESLENILQMDYKAYLFSLSFSSLKQNMEIKKQTVHSSTCMSQVWVFMVTNSICTAFTIYNVIWRDFSHLDKNPRNLSWRNSVPCLSRKLQLSSN